MAVIRLAHSMDIRTECELNTEIYRVKYGPENPKNTTIFYTVYRSVCNVNILHTVQLPNSPSY